MSIDLRGTDYVARLREESRRPRILACGDSWFSPERHRGLLHGIDALGSYHILNVSTGDGELGPMLDGARRARLRNLLDDDTLGFELVLFSAGLGDLVGESLTALLRDLPAGGQWPDALESQRVERRLSLVEHHLHELVDIRDDYRPSVEVLVHGFDFPTPGQGPRRLGAPPVGGSWMVPYLECRGVESRDDQRALVRHLLERLDQTLDSVARARRGLVHVRTQGTLDPSEWEDELHPTADGFARIAEHYRPHLGRHFPMHTR